MALLICLIFTAFSYEGPAAGILKYAALFISATHATGTLCTHVYSTVRRSPSL
jgi:hypothetical protein